MDSEKMKKALMGLEQQMIEESYARNGEWITKMIKTIGEDEVKDPDNVNAFVYEETDEKKEILVNYIVEMFYKGMEPTNKIKLEDLYLQYEMVTNILDKKMEEYEGMACSHDKTYIMVQKYKKYLETGEKKEITSEEYYIPKMKNLNIWFELIESIVKLKYGETSEFMDAMNKFNIEYEKLKTKKEQ